MVGTEVKCSACPEGLLYAVLKGGDETAKKEFRIPPPRSMAVFPLMRRDSQAECRLPWLKSNLHPPLSV